ncbi:GIY-YIG nuclease family protein [Mariprofundus sp. EBB-1]|uniref:GIY-YIG nuclease family protein n=1 Tax=Mariprofundus sp. EBB-1 TaxID=2650971 RepID=UPI00351154EA
MLECRGGGIYVGIAKDVEKRFKVHESGRGSLFTKINTPIQIIAKVKVGSHGDAIRVERAMKKLTPYEKRQWCNALGTDGRDIPISSMF